MKATRRTEDPRRRDLAVLVKLLGIWLALLAVSAGLFFADSHLIRSSGMSWAAWVAMLLVIAVFWLSVVKLVLLIRFAVRYPRRFWIPLVLWVVELPLFCVYAYIVVSMTGL